MLDAFLSYLPLLAALAGAGLTAGLLAGLFGIGGGIVLVPVMLYLFTFMGFEDTAIFVAVSTSLATIIATSARSVMAHNQRGAVDWAVLKTWAPWIVIGAIAGTMIASQISAKALTLFFGGMAFLISLQFFFGRPDWSLAKELPGGVMRAGLGSGVGVLSAMMGIGGGTFGVTLMTVCGQSMHRAIGTAAGFGVAIGLPGAVSAMIVGSGTTGLPPGSIGFVNLPAALIISILTVSMAPYGARLAHALDPARLKRLFSILLAVLALNLIRTQLFG
ncbi:MAG: sulfite exporter TauE/SafE family protein [Pseudomonadota bacterium]